VELADPEEIRPEVPGFIAEIYVKEGDKVTPGQPLARLVNRELEQQVVSVTQHLEMTRANMQRALGMDRPAEYKQFESQRTEYERKVEQAKKDVESLTLKATTHGTVLTRELQKKIGYGLRSGELFCQVGSLNPMQIKMALNEKQVRYIQKGQLVEMKADAYPWKTIRGTIAEVHPMLLSKDLPPALSARRAGDVPTGVNAEGHEVPLERTFEARIDVDNSEGLLRPGMTGHGKIHAGRRLWGKLMFQSMLDLVSLDFRF
jgi:HlyD family secretion protein